MFTQRYRVLQTPYIVMCMYIYIYMGVSKNNGTPKWIVYNGNPYQIWYPYFRKHPYISIFISMFPSSQAARSSGLPNCQHLLLLVIALFHLIAPLKNQKKNAPQKLEEFFHIYYARELEHIYVYIHIDTPKHDGLEDVYPFKFMLFWIYIYIHL